MGASLGASKGPIADINVTPLIDVTLVLLVVFMVITPMLQAGLPVSLPKASQTRTANNDEYITISVGTNLKCREFPCDLPADWFVEQERVDKDTLWSTIRSEWARNAERGLLIKADRRLRYRQVRELMDILAENRSTSVVVATDKEK
jgi:biopolymer transport protein TolR